MPREDSRLAAEGRIERVVLRRRFVLVFMPMIVVVRAMGMIVLGELRLVAVHPAAAIDDDRDCKLVGLRNLLDRFPIGAVIREQESSTLVSIPPGLNRDGVGAYAGQPKARRDAGLEDRQFEVAFLRGNALQPRPVDGARVGSMVVSMEVGNAMTVAMPVPAVPLQIAP